MCYRCQEVGGGDGKYSVIIIVVYVLYSICNVVFSSDTKPIGVIAKPQLVVLNTYENNSYDMIIIITTLSLLHNNNDDNV